MYGHPFQVARCHTKQKRKSGQQSRAQATTTPGTSARVVSQILHSKSRQPLPEGRAQTYRAYRESAHRVVLVLFLILDQLAVLFLLFTFHFLLHLIPFYIPGVFPCWCEENTVKQSFLTMQKSFPHHLFLRNLQNRLWN